jgi:hypothetical protein
MLFELRAEYGDIYQREPVNKIPTLIFCPWCGLKPEEKFGNAIVEYFCSKCGIYITCFKAEMTIDDS